MDIIDVSGVAPDLATVEALARSQLAAKRAGREIRLAGASDDLLALFDLAGLAGVLTAAGAEG